MICTKTAHTLSKYLSTPHMKVAAQVACAARFVQGRDLATHRNASVVDSDSYSSSFAVAASDFAAASGPMAVCAACALTYACRAHILDSALAYKVLWTVCRSAPGA